MSVFDFLDAAYGHVNFGCYFCSGILLVFQVKRRRIAKGRKVGKKLVTPLWDKKKIRS